MLHVLFNMKIADLSHVLFYTQNIKWIIQLQFSLFCLFLSFLLWSQQHWVIIMLICHVLYSVHSVLNETCDKSVMLMLLIDTDLLHLISLSHVLFSTSCIKWSMWQINKINSTDWYRFIACQRNSTSINLSIYSYTTQF